MTHWGHRLDTILRLRGYQKSYAVAHALNVNESTISRWRNGGPISMKHGVELCHFLGVSMDWLFLGEELSGISFPTEEIRLTIELSRRLRSQPTAVTVALIQLIDSLEHEKTL